VRLSAKVILGCGNFGGIGSAPALFGQGESEDEAFALMDAAWDRGIRAFDTADAYGGGRSETWIGRWMAERGRRPSITTKVFHSVVGDPHDRGLARERILRQIDGSLERLGLERLDVYLIHEPDPETPLAETLGAMVELLEAGKVGAVGASNVDRSWLEEALSLAPIAVVQNSYSLLDREPEAEVIPFCVDHEIAFTAFGPLAGGWLTGKYRRGEQHPAGSRMTQRPEGYAHFEREDVYEALERLRERGDMPTLAFAWIFSNPDVAAVVVGPRRPEHLNPAFAALELPLSPEERDELASLFP
jgi:aryl-alcohol dehydrogenase-like predicted oxidoreductase